MTFCSRCGKEAPSEALYCSRCGAALASSTGRSLTSSESQRFPPSASSGAQLSQRRNRPPVSTHGRGGFPDLRSNSAVPDWPITPSQSGVVRLQEAPALREFWAEAAILVDRTIDVNRVLKALQGGEPLRFEARTWGVVDGWEESAESGAGGREHEGEPADYLKVRRDDLSADVHLRRDGLILCRSATSEQNARFAIGEMVNLLRREGIFGHDVSSLVEYMVTRAEVVFGTGIEIRLVPQHFPDSVYVERRSLPPVRSGGRMVINAAFRAIQNKGGTLHELRDGNTGPAVREMFDVLSKRSLSYGALLPGGGPARWAGAMPRDPRTVTTHAELVANDLARRFSYGYHLLGRRGSSEHSTYCMIGNPPVLAHMGRASGDGGIMEMSGEVTLLGATSEAWAREVASRFGSMLETAGLLRTPVPGES